jgi:pyridoxal phosphate enzyme (YggS family)
MAMPPPEDHADLERSIQDVRDRIAQACRRAGRDPAGVRLVGASKTIPVATVEAARHAGLRDFAENYAGELAEKATALPDATWHYIGRLQRGTAAKVARHAALIHSAEPGTGLEHVAGRAAAAGRTILCLAQVDLTGTAGEEPGDRQGVSPEDLAPFLAEAGKLPGIRLVGLMTMPAFDPDPEAARPAFARLRDLRDGLRTRLPELEELSMGMSVDYTVAVEEGSTMVRVGTALFGPRPVRQPRTGGL